MSDDKFGAYGAFNVFNYETIRGLFLAAYKAKRWVYLQTSSSLVKYYSPKTLIDLIQTGSNGFDRTLVKIHLDHCNDFDLIEECIKCGWDSVMIDASHLPLTENIYSTKKVVEIAHSKNVLVEGELGRIGGEEDDNINVIVEKVNVEEVGEYVRNTNVDLLALGIGNIHGYYRGKDSNIDLSLLKSIHERIPERLLVLHGGTGMSGIEIRQAIKYGVHKINISTELKDCYLNTVSQHINSEDKHNMKKMVDLSVNAIAEFVYNKINVFAGNRK